MAEAAELWDLYGADGRPLGTDFPKSRADELPEGAYHLVADVCVVTEKNELLVTQRAPEKRFPYCWEFPGGGVRKGETAAEGAARELFEETGIRVSPSSLAPIYRLLERNVLYCSFLARIPGSAVPVRLQPGETMGFRFVPYADFPAFLSENPNIIEHHLRRTDAFDRLLRENPVKI